MLPKWTIPSSLFANSNFNLFIIAQTGNDVGGRWEKPPAPISNMKMKVTELVIDIGSGSFRLYCVPDRALISLMIYQLELLIKDKIMDST